MQTFCDLYSHRMYKYQGHMRHSHLLTV